MHRYPSTFEPQQAAAWGVANALIPSPDSHQIGAPCTQFVSRALHAAGMPYTKDWYPRTDAIADYMYGGFYQPAWYAADNLREWLLANQWVTQRQIYPGVTPTEIALGDLVYYRWYGIPGKHTHLAMVTKISGGNTFVTDQGGSVLYPESINKLWRKGHAGNDLGTDYPSMKVFILHWQ
ncbi:amidase domain-containing protein [Streptomyces phaeochromogenes]